ncbi:unnamed protein product [Adineta steineri]|uniref:Uncharacterized protein n=1 Tax=Adineta steineri TaxID=433720 RepID=A0A814BBH8_9BILA|nr:unnamed protein product [Adineta steineri]CAF1264306.1 unnamed protein product [Adineta steineri]
MLDYDIETEDGYNVSEITPRPVLRSSLSVPFPQPDDQEYSSTKPKKLQRQSTLVSTLDFNLLTRAISNARPYGSNAVRQALGRHSNDTIKAENLQEPQLASEERQENAIFKIYLKRTRKKSLVSTGSSSTLNKLGTEQDNSLNNNRGEHLYSAVKIYQLKAGTLEKVVECLTSKHGDLDTSHMHILFATYRTYTNTRTLIETILARYRAVVPASLDMTEDVRQKNLKSLSTALTCLLTAYKEDFYEPPHYSTLNYLLEHVPDQDFKKQCQNLLHRFLKEGADIFHSDSNIRTSINDVDNNNNSRTSYTDELLYNQKGFGTSAQRNFLDMSSVKIAEQLTIVDAELLKQVLPYECLTMGKTNNNRRGLNSNYPLSTADKTIEQFNAVTYRVIATILKENNEHLRARIIEKWIDIAHECRQLKNFSSLTAILNGLQSGCIYRLNTAWSRVDSSQNSIFDELKSIFGSCGANRQQARAILDKEATAKYVDVTTINNATLGRKFRLKQKRDQENKMIGTVPYLGLYLSDLVFIDAAHENYITINDNTKTPQKLINFEKHRKKFEILAQIKLFQSAANAYTTLQRIPYFQTWFDNIHIYTDAETWERSYQIEPKKLVDSTDNPQQKLRDNLTLKSGTGPLRAFQSQGSLESITTINYQIPEVTIPSSGSSPSSTSFDKISLTSSLHSFAQRQQSTNASEKKTHSRSSSSDLSFLTNASSSIGYMSAQASPTTSVVNCTFNQPVENNTLIAKVQFVGRPDLLYKKVRIGDNERASNVLKTILDKFGFDPATSDHYCIEQQLSDRKIVLKDDATVFYALLKTPDEQVELIVREKTRQEMEQTKIRFHPAMGHNRTPSGLSITSTHSR